MEIMCKRGDCLIAINDGLDSFSGEDDCTLFRNIMNKETPCGCIKADKKSEKYQ